jgi:hypothetical protein
MPQLSMGDITRITMLKLCSDPDTLAQMMLASSGADIEYDTNGATCKDLLEFCKREGINLGPAIKIALEPGSFERAIFGNRRQP